ncbi:MAG: AbfB domain-containing protein, partial [Sedimentisphaerales bacterium]|nr:AbfB domain-containing protein [Sedimentisphaerales bacterium]
MNKKLVSLIVLTPLLAGLLHAQTIPTATTTLESYDMPGHFVVCTTSAGAVQVVLDGDQTPQGQWNIVAGLTGTDTVSFMPVALANHYMRHRSFVLYCDQAATDNLYLNDASFVPVPGLADPTCVSFRSVNYTDRYLLHNTSSPMGLVLQAVVAGNEGAATFKFPEQYLKVATDPFPGDEATDVLRETTLSWMPGAYAASHDVYFGTSFDDVNSADRSAPLGVLVRQGQDANTYDPPGLLDFGQTYYWRIDEVNAP